MESAQNRGGRNLMMLGIGAVTIAIMTTAISLLIYHRSGDIYLDRSRPGFLPEEGEDIEEQAEGAYKFSDTGEVDAEALEEYLKELEEVAGKEVKEPFSASALSDETLGIPAEGKAKTGKKK